MSQPPRNWNEKDEELSNKNWQRTLTDITQKTKLKEPLSRCSTSLIIKSMPIKMFQYIISHISGYQNTKTLTIQLCKPGYGKRHSHTLLLGLPNSTMLREGNAAKFIKITNAFISWLSNPTSENWSDKLPTNICKYMNKWIYKVICWSTVIAKTGITPNTPQ